MKTVREVAVAMITASILMIVFAQTFFTWWMKGAFQIWALAVQAVSPDVANVAGISIIGTTVFVFCCAGIAMLLSATLYSKVDDFVLGYGNRAVQHFAS